MTSAGAVFVLWEMVFCPITYKTCYGVEQWRFYNVYENEKHCQSGLSARLGIPEASYGESKNKLARAKCVPLGVDPRQ